jgi:hypothetical protein
MRDNGEMKLPAKVRNKLPSSAFGMPSQRKYPMPDASHAANAKARASQAVHAGRMSTSTRAKIEAKANRVLGHKNVVNPGSHAGKMACC